MPYDFIFFYCFISTIYAQNNVRTTAESPVAPGSLARVVERSSRPLSLQHQHNPLDQHVRPPCQNLMCHQHILQNVEAVANNINTNLNLNLNLEFKTDELHVTLLFVSSHEKSVSDVFTDRLVERFTTGRRDISVTSSKIVYDDKCAVLLIERDGEIENLCANEFPHMTLGTAPGVKPSYSNIMLKSEKYTVMPLKKPLKMLLSIEPVRK